MVTTTTLESSIQGIRSVWGPLSTEVISGCRRHLEELLKAPATEDWLSALQHEAPAKRRPDPDPKARP